MITTQKAEEAEPILWPSALKIPLRVIVVETFRRSMQNYLIQQTVQRQAVKILEAPALAHLQALGAQVNKQVSLLNITFSLYTC